MNGKERDVDDLLEYVNSLHPNIKFTYETENNFELSFLDVIRSYVKEHQCRNYLLLKNMSRT